MIRLFEREDVARRQSAEDDRLDRIVLWDLLITTAGFLLTIAAVVLALQGLSVN